MQFTCASRRLSPHHPLVAALAGLLLAAPFSLRAAEVFTPGQTQVLEATR